MSGWQWLDGILLAALGAGEPGDGARAALGAALGLDAITLGIAAAAPVMIGVILWRRWYRLPRPVVPMALSPLAGLALLFMMFALGLLGAEVGRLVILPAEAGGSELADHARMRIGPFIGQAVAVAVFLWACRGENRSRAAGMGASVVIAMVTLVALWPVMAGASLVSGLVAWAIQGEPMDAIAHETLKQLVESPADAWLAVVAVQVVLVTPVLEEVMYRGILQRTLVKLDLGRWTAILVTSTVFVTMHGSVVPLHGLPPLFVLALGFGWVYERTGRLTAPIVMHILFNAINLGLAWRMGAG